jgi:hypothetical protein
MGADYTLKRGDLLHGRLERLRTDLPNDQQDLWRVVAGIHRPIQTNLRATLEVGITDHHAQSDELEVYLGTLWAF